jgi:hypothetical protein
MATAAYIMVSTTVVLLSEEQSSHGIVLNQWAERGIFALNSSLRSFTPMAQKQGEPDPID